MKGGPLLEAKGKWNKAHMLSSKFYHNSLNWTKARVSKAYIGMDKLGSKGEKGGKNYRRRKGRMGGSGGRELEFTCICSIFYVFISPIMWEFYKILFLQIFMRNCQGRSTIGRRG